jgi:hypothetical protein
MTLEHVGGLSDRYETLRNAKIWEKQKREKNAHCAQHLARPSTCWVWQRIPTSQVGTHLWQAQSARFALLMRHAIQIPTLRRHEENMALASRRRTETGKNKIYLRAQVLASGTVAARIGSSPRRSTFLVARQLMPQRHGMGGTRDWQRQTQATQSRHSRLALPLSPAAAPQTLPNIDPSTVLRIVIASRGCTHSLAPGTDQPRPAFA